MVRPWGSWTVVDEGEGYKTKRIVVRPGHRLSLQRHAQRKEHWFVVSGEIEAAIDDVVTTVAEGESVDVPLGASHRLSNPGVAVAVIVEVQQGAYCDEDDIERLHDDYGRIDSIGQADPVIATPRSSPA